MIKKETFYLVYNWQSGTHRLIKSKPAVTPGQIAFQIALEVNVPEVDVPKLALRYDVPVAHVESVVGDRIVAELLGPDGQPMALNGTA